MAQRLVDDLDNSLFADRTVTFSLDSVAYEIDLAPENRQRLTEALDPFIRAGRPRHRMTPQPRSGKLNVSRSHKTPPGRAEQLAAIRAWARQAGYDVSQRGRIPEVVMEAFERAHRGDPNRDGVTPAFSSAV